MSKGDQIEHLLTHAVEQIHVRESLEAKLRGRKKLRVKLGVDPTSPNLHLGHTVVLRKLREFQELGHTVIFLIGDGTGLIGDPTGRKKTRPQLTARELKKNSETYLRQVGKILDVRHAEIRRNSEWYKKMSFLEFIDIASRVTVAHSLEREDFQERLKKGDDIALHETFYPLMQGYDSVMLKADVELGASEQLVNLLMGRELQKKFNLEPQDVLTTPILVGTDGVEKMSKSQGNSIGVTETPQDIFAKVMKIPDKHIETYARLAAWWDAQRIDELAKRMKAGENPRDIKADVAEAIVAFYHGDKHAQHAREHFSRVFTKKTFPVDMTTISLEGASWDPVELLLFIRAAVSKSNARRLIEQGGVRLNEEKVTSWDTPLLLHDGAVLQVGKRSFWKIQVSGGR